VNTEAPRLLPFSPLTPVPSAGLNQLSVIPNQLLLSG